MTNIQRLPHTGMGLYWIFWTLSTIPALVAVALGLGPWYGLLIWTIWFLAFLIPETIVTRLLKTRLRDTLSEVVTWAHRQMARKGIIAPDRGWTAAFTAIIALISVMGAMPWFVVSAHAVVGVAIPLAMLGGLQTWLVGRWLYDHWILTRDFG